ncbi:hypothetical protein Tco_1071056 [Tanacetum coccineum]|uniref:Uncharacterized protein n=1 Tax=Tanacetum coccineum TaxID=301880 RepID=A0ABQ5HPJ4_9ASTR
MSKLVDSWFRRVLLGGRPGIKAVTLERFLSVIALLSKENETLGKNTVPIGINALLSLDDKRTVEILRSDFVFGIKIFMSKVYSYGEGGDVCEAVRSPYFIQRVVDAGMFHGIDVVVWLILIAMFYAVIKFNMCKSKNSMGIEVDNGKGSRAATKFGCVIQSSGISSKYNLQLVRRGYNGANGKIDEISGKGANSCWINIIKEVRRLEEKVGQKLAHPSLYHSFRRHPRGGCGNGNSPQVEELDVSVLTIVVLTQSTDSVLDIEPIWWLYRGLVKNM